MCRRTTGTSLGWQQSMHVFYDQLSKFLRGDEKSPPPQVISSTTLQRSIELCNYFTAQRRILDQVSGYSIIIMPGTSHFHVTCLVMVLRDIHLHSKHIADVLKTWIQIKTFPKSKMLLLGQKYMHVEVTQTCKYMYQMQCQNNCTGVDVGQKDWYCTM